MLFLLVDLYFLSICSPHSAKYSCSLSPKFLYGKSINFRSAFSLGFYVPTANLSFHITLSFVFDADSAIKFTYFRNKTVSGYYIIYPFCVQRQNDHITATFIAFLCSPFNSSYRFSLHWSFSSSSPVSLQPGFCSE